MQKKSHIKQSSNEEWVKNRQQNLNSQKVRPKFTKKTKQDKSFRNHHDSYEYQDEFFLFNFFRTLTFF